MPYLSIEDNKTLHMDKLTMWKQKLNPKKPKTWRRCQEKMWKPMKKIMSNGIKVFYLCINLEVEVFFKG
jgi:hypothetical protein